MKNKILIFTLMVLSIFLLTNCGHNITHTDRGTGLVLRIPTPDGNALVDIKLGKIDSTTTILRGGATYDSTTATGGSLFGSAGTSQHIQVKTIPQCNEGYIAEILTSPNCPANVKQALTNYLRSQQSPDAAQSSSTTVGASSASGTSAVKVTSPLDVSHPIAQAVGKVSTTINNITGTVKLSIILIAAGVVLFVLLIIWIVCIIKKRKAKKEIDRIKTAMEASKKLYKYIS